MGYVSAVLTYSDLLFCISRSTEADIHELARKIGVDRYIPSTVMRLGSDFIDSTGDLPEDHESDDLVKSVMKTKYLLFVGTIEPRKRQDHALKAFEQLAKTREDINMVFVGKQGWNTAQLVGKIMRHKLKDKRLFWFNNLNDHDLKQLYKKAYIVTYLSSYEGYGLPIAEALSYGKVTIAYDNSSQYEAGMNFADYARYETPNEVADIVSSYLDNPELYKKKTEYIKSQYTPFSWSQAYGRIHDVLDNLERSNLLANRPLPEKLQFVFISNRVEDLAGTIRQHDMRTPFVKEYVVVTPQALIKEVESIPSKHRIIAVNEAKLLGKKYKKFKESDHVTKNWMLRAAVPDIDVIDDEFVMNDDDNRPMVELSRDFFINEDGTYNAYYFYELPRWVHRSSEYDNAQHISTKYLSQEGTELLLYSAHQPQIFNTELFREAIKLVEDRNMELPVDEWSTYFNYSISRLPMLYRKKPFETLTWPAYPRSWNFWVEPARYTIENYYEHLYDAGDLFEGVDIDDSEEKMKRVTIRENHFRDSRERMAESRSISHKYNAAHGVATFKSKNRQMFVSGLPYIIGAMEQSTVHFYINVKIVYSGKPPNEFRVDAVDRLGRTIAGATYKTYKIGRGYYEAVMSFAVQAKKPGKQYLTFRAFADGKLIPSAPGSYESLLVVTKTDQSLRSAIN